MTNMKREFEIKIKLDELRVLNERVKEYDEKMDELKKVEKSIDHHKEEWRRMLENIHELKTEISMLENKQREMAKKKDDEKRMMEEKRLLEKMIQIVDRNGLPLFLLTEKINMLEEYANELLQTFLDKRFIIQIRESDIVVGLENGMDGVTNFLGGMESFLIDLIFKLSVSFYARLPKSNFFFIDEGISVLDKERLSNIQQLFDFLSQNMEHVFLISHLPTITDYVTQSFQIYKKDGKSTLIFQK